MNITILANNKQQFIVRQRIIFIPVPEKYYNNYELIDILMDRIHKAALTIARMRSNPTIKILVHEHAFFIKKNACGSNLLKLQVTRI